MCRSTPIIWAKHMSWYTPNAEGPGFKEGQCGVRQSCDWGYNSCSLNVYCRPGTSHASHLTATHEAICWGKKTEFHLQQATQWECSRDPKRNSIQYTSCILWSSCPAEGKCVLQWHMKSLQMSILFPFRKWRVVCCVADTHTFPDTLTQNNHTETILFVILFGQ